MNLKKEMSIPMLFKSARNCGPALAGQQFLSRRRIWNDVSYA